MTYRVDLSSVAKAEADAAFLSFSQYTTPEQAQRWYQGLIKQQFQIPRYGHCETTRVMSRP